MIVLASLLVQGIYDLLEESGCPATPPPLPPPPRLNPGSLPS